MTTTHPDTTTVTIWHPNATLLAADPSIHEVYRSARRGDWSVIADLCASEAGGGKIKDLDQARSVLTDHARASGYTFLSAHDADTLITGALVTDAENRTGYQLHGAKSDLIDALDLYMRIICGQWDEISWAPSLHSPTYNPRYERNLTRVRGDLCHTRNQPSQPLEPHQYPAHPAGSVSIASATPAARLAYHAYKHLGAGAPGAPTFPLDHGPVTVDLDDQPINLSRQR